MNTETRLEQLESELAAVKTMLATSLQHVAQQPRRVAAEDLLHILAQDRTRLRAVSERLDELTGLVICRGWKHG